MIYLWSKVRLHANEILILNLNASGGKITNTDKIAAYSFARLTQLRLKYNNIRVTYANGDVQIFLN